MANMAPYAFDKPISQVLAENLKSQMAKHKGMTVASLSRLSGVSRGQISNMLNQKSATTTDTLERLATVLKTHPSSLLSVQTQVKTPVKDSFRTALSNLEPNEPKRPDAEDFARWLLHASFTNTDDEGKLTLLRMAASFFGWVPDMTGVKLPRDWRDFADIAARECGGYFKLMETYRTQLIFYQRYLSETVDELSETKGK